MSKTPKIVVANAGILVLYAGGLGISYWLGISIEDLIKLVPTALASAIANMTTLTIALIAIVKGTASFKIGAPEQDNWSVIVPLYINCQGASGVRLERIDANQLDVVKLSEGTARNAVELPIDVNAGQVADFYIHFDVLKGNQGEIDKHRKLMICFSYSVEGKQNRYEISKSCPNVFRRKYK